MFPSPSLKNKTWPIIWNLMGPLWPPHPKHPPPEAASSWMWRCHSQAFLPISTGWASPCAIEQRHFHFLKTYILYICFYNLSLVLFLCVPALLIHVALPHSFCCWVFSSLFLLLLILGRDGKCRLGHRWPGLKSSLCHLLQAKYISVAPFSHL